MFKKNITSDFFTTISLRQAFLSVYLMTVWSYKLRYWKDKELFEQELWEYLWKGDKKVLSFYNGRNALYHALKIIWVDEKDEVVVNAYTCSVVVNAVIQSGGKIVYSDIEEESLSLDYEELKKNISQNTKVIVLQHTFWKQARDYKKIIELAQSKKIVVIEDCALSLGNKQGQTQDIAPTETGRGEPCAHPEILWDFAIFSTGRDKVISSVTGGFLLVNNDEYLESEYMLSLEDNLKMPSRTLVFQNLMYNIVWYKAYKLYDFFKLWRVAMFLSRKFHLITDIMCQKEKNFEYHDFKLAYPNSLAYLASNELKKLDKYTEIRKSNAEFSLKNIKNKKISLPFSKDTLTSLGHSKVPEGGGIRTGGFNYFRIPILLKSQQEAELLYSYMRQNDVLLWKAWNWIHIVPVGTNLEKAWYIWESCKIAEDISKRILMLPNHIWVTQKDLERVVWLINNFK